MPSCFLKHHASLLVFNKMIIVQRHCLAVPRQVRKGRQTHKHSFVHSFIRSFVHLSCRSSIGAEGTTNPQAPFGIVMVADSTDEGWGCNVPQMNWAQTANHGVAPNIHLPNTYFAATHDLADPWADGCMQGSKCCVDTGSAPDPACDPRNDGRFLVQTGQYPGSGEPVTPSMGVTIHPRVKRQVGARLAQAAWSLYYNHPEVAHTGPVISGCSLGGSVPTYYLIILTERIT